MRARFIKEFVPRSWFHPKGIYKVVERLKNRLPDKLLEYSYWPGSQSVEQIWVVGPTHMDDKSTEYIESLKSQFGLPIGYVHQPVEDSG